jgi:hypothetical protein
MHRRDPQTAPPLAVVVTVRFSPVHTQARYICLISTDAISLMSFEWKG